MPFIVGGPRPAIACPRGTLDHDGGFLNLTMVHVEPTDNEVQWYCCGVDAIDCSEPLNTPHELALPEPEISMALMVSVLLLGMLKRRRG